MSPTNAQFIIVQPTTLNEPSAQLTPRFVIMNLVLLRQLIIIYTKNPSFNLLVWGSLRLVPIILHNPGFSSEQVGSLHGCTCSGVQCGDTQVRTLHGCTCSGVQCGDTSFNCKNADYQKSTIN